MARVKVKCPTCKGEGMMPRPKNEGDINGRFLESFPGLCIDCDGATTIWRDMAIQETGSGDKLVEPNAGD